ncbi:hypothetical protein EV421DRAFT_1738453 [Armillaria borealis]|uniref:Uncharacterized protein n=1 Tax=Armillaria borealis TaxID=47425 RepID=A0AA39J931_9AGAR|nr:hypothetical protein EV421DRAFT_1738453 [Armillaria borealis]
MQDERSSKVTCPKIQRRLPVICKVPQRRRIESTSQPAVGINHMGHPKKHVTEESRLAANRDKSNHSYAKNQNAIRLRRKDVYKKSGQDKHLHQIRGSNALELRKATSSHSQPMPSVVENKSDPMIELCVRAKRIEVDFGAFIDNDPVAYAKSLMHRYFCDRIIQGCIKVFTDPLSQLYEWRTSYETVLDAVLQLDGCSPRRAAMQKVGQPLWDTIGYLENIWCSAIEGPKELRDAYNRKRLTWQRAL